MVPIRLTSMEQDSGANLTTQHKATLLQVAKSSIEYGLSHRNPPVLEIEVYPAELQCQRATFVTLEIEQKLRGCIGILEATRPLVLDIAHHAHAAAFKDPRFSPVSDAEFNQLSISISILSPSQEIIFTSQDDLVAQLQPGIDGLILEEGAAHRGTFLPTVWNSLPKPYDFLQQLKKKAGLPVDYWSDSLRIYRYTTESIRPPD